MLEKFLLFKNKQFIKCLFPIFRVTHLQSVFVHPATINSITCFGCKPKAQGDDHVPKPFRHVAF
jgi:hypothetical protein